MGICIHSQSRLCDLCCCDRLCLKAIQSFTNSISVKGLSEKPIKADSARWEINVQTPTASNSIPEAYQLLDQNLKTLQAFFVEQGFKATDLQQGNKSNRYRRII